MAILSGFNRLTLTLTLALSLTLTLTLAPTLTLTLTLTSPQVPRDKRDVQEVFRRFGQTAAAEAETQSFHQEAKNYLCRKALQTPDQSDAPKVTWHRRSPSNNIMKKST